ncbi:translational GTPase TypA [Thiomicrorhabdus sp. 6S2-11]|jgi:GTP-binding protein|uniref:Large ribosomal subunit assembly factor BipA n=1 Tax=Thiomicrorhabdus marina TaxID=2818442 RepID=A0ABS3Q2G6_9GAMM|nr:translational GTPase TypA [Thiomicrorhabdus marina]MBO1926509.1 translational GTPase TypA [Thiomicrorhabdus marina]
MTTQNIRNIAIIAHVDHGKTTLVDQLLRQSGTLDERKDTGERVMDSNDLEKERGITILSKNTAINWNDYRINIVDTPGHADFGGEVERILSMVDSVLLLVDSVEGPMPQTRFVTEKALQQGLKPIVVINKIDRPGARPDWVLDQTFDLFDRLGATDEQMDFNVLYASGLNGFAGYEEDVRDGDMQAVFETIIDKVPAPDVDIEAPFQLQCISLDYDTYKGVIGTGRIKRGIAKVGMQVSIIDAQGNTRKGKFGEIFGYHGLERINVDEAHAGDIIAFSGFDPLNISDTICDPDNVEALVALTVDEPTVSMTFQVNDSPFVGQEGKLLTSRQIRERLDKELLTNVALRVEDTEDANKFRVSGRGELHLSVLIETMRREGFEMGISRPEVIFREIDGEIQEPYENLTVDVPEESQGTIMEKLGLRKAEMQDMVPDGHGRVRVDFIIPSRGLIGFRTEFMTATQGNGLIFSSFSHYGPKFAGSVGERNNGVLISNDKGKALSYALYNLQDRGRLYIGHGEEVYEGMIIGLHSRANDLTVNALKGKQLTNVRASGTDEALTLVPPVRFSLEQALEFIDDDELVEVTPESIRIRKKYLTENERKRASRASKDA